MTVLTVGRDAYAGLDHAVRYARHRPEQTLLYQIVQTHTPAFLVELAARERTLPDYVQREFEDYLACGRLEHGFLRVRCTACHAERLVAFSCKRRGFCPSCGAQRMAESAALLVDESFPRLPIRQWVLSVIQRPSAVSHFKWSIPSSVTPGSRIELRYVGGAHESH